MTRLDRAVRLLRIRSSAVARRGRLLTELLPALEGEEVARVLGAALGERLGRRPWLLLAPSLGIIHAPGERLPPALIASGLTLCGEGGPARDRLLLLAGGQTAQGARRAGGVRCFRPVEGTEPVLLVGARPPVRIGAGEISFLLELGAAAFARAARYREALDLERMQAYFVSMVSHEFRTPLSTLRGSIENLMDGMAGPVAPAQLEYLQMMQQGIDHLVHLVDNVLDLARLEAGREVWDFAEVALPDLLRPAAEGFRMLAGRRGIAFEAAWPADLPAVRADAQRFLQVVTNLVGNAVKYTGEGGRVTLSLEALDPGDGEIVRASVADTGVGIDVKDQARIFDRFYRVDRPDRRREKGMGIGLAIAREIVEAHGGRIWVESAPGQGSVFRFTVPTARAAARAGAGR